MENIGGGDDVIDIEESGRLALRFAVCGLKEFGERELEKDP